MYEINNIIIIIIQWTRPWETDCVSKRGRSGESMNAPSYGLNLFLRNIP